MSVTSRGVAIGRRGNRKRKPQGGVAAFLRVPLKLRVHVFNGLIVGCFCLMGTRVFMLGFEESREPSRWQMVREHASPVRGDIYDANGELVATSLKVYSVYADPAQIVAAPQAARQLAEVLNIPAAQLEKNLARKGRFVWLERGVTPQQVADVNRLGLPGVGFREEFSRFYPQGNLMAHVLGNVNRDNLGKSGVEWAYDDQLRGGQHVQLTLDGRLQTVLHEVLVETLRESGAEAAWGTVINPQTGEVKAMVSLPDYDPNHYGSSPEETWKNRATFGVYEMGSTFKVFSVAHGLEEKIVTPQTVLDCTEPLQVGKHRIHDFHAKRRPMSTQEVFRYSSNIGVARIADMSDPVRYRAFYEGLGLLDGLQNVGLLELSEPDYPHESWRRIRRMTMAYGHGIAVSPLHLVSAFGAVVGDGYYRSPYLVKPADFEPTTPIRRVLSPQTVAQMRAMLLDAVENGTGRKAQVAGYLIGGKTGTAERAVGGGYSEKENLASFVGAFPMNNPEYAVLIMVDRPKGEFTGGGTVAAPAFAKFVQRMAPVVGMAPQVPLDGRPALDVQLAQSPEDYVNTTPDTEGDILDELFRLATAAGG